VNAGAVVEKTLTHVQQKISGDVHGRNDTTRDPEILCLFESQLGVTGLVKHIVTHHANSPAVEQNDKKLRYHEGLQRVSALFTALFTLALPRSPHAETHNLDVALFSK